MAFGLLRAKVLGELSVQLVSKISNLCGPDAPTDRRTDRRHAIARRALHYGASRGNNAKGTVIAASLNSYRYIGA